MSDLYAPYQGKDGKWRIVSPKGNVGHRPYPSRAKAQTQADAMNRGEG